MGTTPLPVVALVRDLIFASKISATAQSLGLAVQFVRDPAKLVDQPAGRLIVDLNLAGAVEAIRTYRQSHPATEIVGFVSHVDTATIGAAREAGVTRVLARSHFVEILPELVRAQGASH